MQRQSTVPALFISLSVVALVAPGCVGPAMVGQPCVDNADCDGITSCIERPGMDPAFVCMLDCDLTMERLCATGEVCTPAVPEPPAMRDPNLGICQLGGNVAVGMPCDLENACVPGAICVARSDVTPSTQNCHRACDTDGSVPCDATQVCFALTGGTSGAGYCAAMP